LGGRLGGRGCEAQGASYTGRGGCEQNLGIGCQLCVLGPIPMRNDCEHAYELTTDYQPPRYGIDTWDQMMMDRDKRLTGSMRGQRVGRAFPYLSQSPSPNSQLSGSTAQLVVTASCICASLCLSADSRPTRSHRRSLRPIVSGRQRGFHRLSVALQCIPYHLLLCSRCLRSLQVYSD